MLIEESSIIGERKSKVIPFTLIPIAALPKPSDMDLAISKPVMPASNCLNEPSGKVIFM